jgi:hypothetical protein
MITSIYEATFLVDLADDIIVNWGRPAQMASLLKESHGGLSLIDFNQLSTNMLESIEFYTGGKAL